jgi:hypothetical protein
MSYTSSSANGEGIGCASGRCRSAVVWSPSISALSHFHLFRPTPQLFPFVNRHGPDSNGLEILKYKGTETIMLADAHFSFFTEAALAERWPDAEYDSIPITDCYVYGPSTRNVRIEGLWRQQRYTTTGPWISYFKLLSLSGFYEQQSLADRLPFRKK